MNPSPYELRPDLPEELNELNELVLDLRWSWSHTADTLWRHIDADTWRQTHNPWLILQTVSLRRLKELAADENFHDLLQEAREDLKQALTGDTWFDQAHADSGPCSVAYFCMEYGLSEALPLYSGGLGVLAGDHLKTCSDLGVPLRAIGLLYQQGYFRQALDREGNQLAFYPFNDPTQLPATPVRTKDGEWLNVHIELPGRSVHLRTWQAKVGRIILYLLDSNDPRNDPVDRGITSELYGGDREIRLQQEMVLGIGGYRLLQALGQEPDICHLNEGHAAFAVLERARAFMQATDVDFSTAMIATRAGNLFTTHTPVAAGFDCFNPTLLKYYLGDWARKTGVPLEQVVALGYSQSGIRQEPFNMAWLAIHGSGAVNGVSRLHGDVSRRLFQVLFPRWPAEEVPVRHVTNGVHVPSWDSPESDRLWTHACGKERWREEPAGRGQAIMQLPDEVLWEMRTRNRMRLIEWIRQRQPYRQIMPGNHAEVLDPNILTLGFARRFASYKRPNLLLQDPQHLAALINHTDQPVQLVLAGKAHPMDYAGQQMIRDWISFIHDFQCQHRVVFLVDYDLLTADRLVAGVDLWINTPRRPWEACGTSGMKVLVNGGLNLSELDGWWAEAWRPEVGWALGDGQEHDNDPAWDEHEASELYKRLENEVIPTFYQRNPRGIPESWVNRVRHSMAELTPTYSCNRMVHEYVEEYYLPMGQQVRRRCSDNGALAHSIRAWRERVEQHWPSIHFGNIEVHTREKAFGLSVQIYLDGLEPSEIQVELYAESLPGAGNAERHPLQCIGELAGSVNGYRYELAIAAQRPASDYTVRVIPFNPDVAVPLEVSEILWQH